MRAQRREAPFPPSPGRRAAGASRSFREAAADGGARGDRLEDKVIDLEVAAGTTSPTAPPSARTVLVGHSMGGIVAAETAIGLASDKPIGSSDGADEGEAAGLNGLMFPYVQGVLALDTPFLGISPGVVARGAEGH